MLILLIMSIDILTLIFYYNHVRSNKRAATDGPEVAGLEWSKVDLENGRLEISANLCYSKEPGIYETTTKTGNVRFVNIPAETVALLRKYRASQAALRLANGARWQGTGYLFTQDDGRPMNPTSITAWLNKFSKRRGLPHIHPHSFRHSVASILISAGTGLVTVAGQLGHTQASTTAEILRNRRFMWSK